MNTLFCVEWTEYERGWGQRPDGAELFLNIEDLENSLKKLADSRKNDKSVPACYSSPERKIIFQLDNKDYKKIKKNFFKERTSGYHSLRYLDEAKLKLEYPSFKVLSTEVIRYAW